MEKFKLEPKCAELKVTPLNEVALNVFFGFQNKLKILEKSSNRLSSSNQMVLILFLKYVGMALKEQNLYFITKQQHIGFWCIL